MDETSPQKNFEMASAFAMVYHPLLCPPDVTVVVKDSPQNMLCLAEKEV
jgi:hypothetical protein